MKQPRIAARSSDPIPARPRDVVAAACACLVLGALVAGCRSTSVPSGGTVLTPSGPTDTSIEACLAILDYRTVGEGTDRAAEFDLQNTTGARLDFRYALDWFDALGKPVAFRSHAWTPLSIEPRARVHVRVSPMPAEARSSRLRFTPTEGRP